MNYGTVTGGIPTKDRNNDYNQWCKDIGKGTAGSVEFKSGIFRGSLYWCNRYDTSTYHWCDIGDGYWKDQTLDARRDFDRISQLTCTGMSDF